MRDMNDIALHFHIENWYSHAKLMETSECWNISNRFGLSLPGTLSLCVQELMIV